MSVVYASPNKSHHFLYAEGLEAEGLLTAFIQGYPRIKKSPIKVDPAKIHYRDTFQLSFLPMYKLLNEHPITHWINLRSKNYIDAGFRKAMEYAQTGLFYNGCGLHTLRHWNSSGRTFICEAVNSHLDYQSDLLREECKQLKIEFSEPYSPERNKRLAEYEESDYILCPSSFVAQSFEKRGIPKKHLLINAFGIGSDTTYGSPLKQDPTSDRFRILYVGSINFRKGLRYLIEAFGQLKISNKELWIVGPRLIPDGISDIPIPESVLFKGVLKGEALKHAYTSSDVFVQPSIEEGLSLVIGEALGYGLPVIATYNTGAEDIFKDGECGYLVPIRDAQIIAERISRLADSNELRKKLSAEAIKKSRHLGGWSASQHSLCSLIRQIQIPAKDD